MKRTLLFLATNLAVVVVLGIVANLLGVNRYLTAQGLNLGALLGFAAIMGFGGAFISLLMSKSIAKWSTGAQVIEQPGNAAERWLVDAVARLASTMILTMRGSVCLYQGEELGLTEANLAFEDLVDPYGIEFWPEFKGRDGSRTPMVWQAAAHLGAFTTAPRAFNLSGSLAKP